MIKNLREYLAMLDSEGWLDHVTEPTEMLRVPAIMKEQEKKERTVIFENIKGFEYSLVNNLFGSRKFLAKVFGCEVNEVALVFAEKSAGRIKPIISDEAPVQEIIFKGEDIDIQRFPFIIHCEKDAGRYITAGMVIAKDPETGIRNCSFNRMQLKGPDKTGFRMSPNQDLESYYKKAVSLGKPLEIAVSIGNHPLDLLAAACGPARDVDEIDIAGSLRGEPVTLTKCISVDLEVPADAEVVLEGYIAVDEMEDEGPFGDFMEFYVPEMKNHVFHCTAVTMRKNPILQAISAGSKDDVTLLATPREAQLYQVLHEMNADITGISLAICNNYLTGAVSIRKNLENEPTNIIMAAFGSFRFLKNFIVVDHDVDVYNPKDIIWAMSTRLRAEKGIMIIPNAVGFGRDVHGIHTTKMGIDSTAPLGCWDEFERITVPMS